MQPVTSIGSIILSGIDTWIYVLAGMFAIWALIHSYFIDKDSAKALKNRTPPTFKEKIEVLPRILPFLAIIAGVLYVLYGGVATPSEASGVGAFLVLF